MVWFILVWFTLLDGRWVPSTLAPVPRKIRVQYPGAIYHVLNRAERIIAEELERLGWSQSEFVFQRKRAVGKLALAARVRRETTMSLKWIAARVSLGTSKRANSKLHFWMKGNKQPDAEFVMAAVETKADQAWDEPNYGLALLYVRGAFSRSDAKQFSADRWINTNGGATAVGKQLGVQVNGSVKLIWPTP